MNKMTKKNILLSCASGMSTSLMVTKMEQAVERRGLDYHIEAIPATAARDYLDENVTDVILLGPQLSYMKDDFMRMTEDNPIPIGVINMADYGMMDGEKTVDFVQELLEK